MIKVKRDFSNRVQEIDLYFSFMEAVMLREAKLIYPDNSVENIESDLNKILLANSFLILYNLTESCIKNAVENIYITIDNDRVKYDDLKENIKKEIIHALKQNIGLDSFVTSVQEVAFDIVITCFDAKQLFSGNLDARKIRTLASKYGFSTTILPIQNSDGSLSNINTDNLNVVKGRRNDLAHGIYSFKECGRDYTIQDVTEIKMHVVEYLSQILSHIENYIDNKDYLAS